MPDSTFGISALALGSMGFIFGISAFTRVAELKKKVQKIDQEIKKIKNLIGSQ